MWMIPLHINQKSDYDDDLINIMQCPLDYLCHMYKKVLFLYGSFFAQSGPGSIELQSVDSVSTAGDQKRRYSAGSSKSFICLYNSLQAVFFFQNQHLSRDWDLKPQTKQINLFFYIFF